MHIISMASPKEQVLEVINSLPEDTSYDEIIEKLYFTRKVRDGLAQLEQGHTVSHAEAKERLKKWLNP